MKSLVKIQLYALTVMILLGSTAFGAIGGTIAASPTQLPKDAYVNGGGDNGDQFFFQNITITDFTGITVGNTDFILINFPTEIQVADPNEDGDYDDGVWLTFSQDAAGGATIVVGTVTSSSIQIDLTTVGTWGGNIADNLSILFPVTTDSLPADLTPTYTIRYSDFSAGPAFLATDDLLTVNMVDTLTLDVFAVDYIGNDDNGSTRGLGYPTDVLATPADIVPAGLPSLILDAFSGNDEGVDLGGAQDDPWGGLLGVNGAFDNGGADDLLDNESVTADDIITYSIWASQMSGLKRVNSDNGHRVIDINDGNPVDVANETGTIAGQLDGRLLVEGNWWFYLTSSVSSDWILASSDTVEIRHQPTFTVGGGAFTNSVAAGGGVDFDGDRNWENSDGLTDDVAAMTVESGGTLGTNGLIGGAGSTDTVNIFYSFDDEDDSATVQIFLSTSAGLVAADIHISGSSPGEVVDSLSSATLFSTEITTTPLPEHTSTPYFTYDNLPSSGTPETPNAYFIYLVVNDGKNQNLLLAQASSGGNIVLTSSHYPFLTLEDYYGEDINVNRGSERYVVISWAGTAKGIDGTKDGDQSPSSPATISIYAVEDGDAIDTWAAAGGTTDPATVDPTLLPAAATARPATVELIGTVTDITSDDAADNRIMWDLWTTGLVADGTYHIYAIITHGSDDLIVDLNDAEEIDGTGTQRNIVITSTNYFLPNNPVANDLVELNNDDLYNFTWTAFNVQTAQTEQVHIFVLPKDTDIDAILLANAPNTQDYDGVIANEANLLGGYWITDADGDGAPDDPVSASAGTYSLDVSKLTTDFNPSVVVPSANADALSEFFTYDVYYIYKSDATFDSEPYVKASGQLHFADDLTVGSSDNFKLSPSKAHLAMGDTVTLTVQFVDAGPNAEWLKYYLNVPKTYFRVLDQDAATSGVQPFSDLTGFVGTNMQNELDSSGTDYHLNRVEYAAGGFNVDPFAAVATFQLVVNLPATDPALVDNIITFNTEQPRLTSYQVTGSGVQVGFTVSDEPANLQLAGRGSISGIVEMEMRTAEGEEITLKITPTGSLVPISDTDFYAASGDKSGTAADGIQLDLGSGGSYTLTQVPGGSYEVWVEKQGWLTRVVKNVQVSPLTTSTADFVAFEQLYAGDAGGFDHDGDGGASTFSQPDNQIDATDLAVHIAAFEAVQGVDDTYNAFADFDNDGINSLTEFAITAKNAGIQIDLLHDGTALLPVGRGEGATFNKSIPFKGDNSRAIAWMSVEERAGQYIYTVHADNLNSLRAYKVALRYDPSEWEVTRWDDGLAEQNETHRFEKTRDHEVKYVSSIRGWDVLVTPTVELMTLSMRARGADATAPVLENVTLVDGNIASAKAIISGTGQAVPAEFTLSQNYPNPFNPITNIDFSLPDKGNVKLAVFNLLGQEISILASGFMAPGAYKAVWNAQDISGRKVSSGLYFYRLTVDNRVVATKKLLLLK